MVPDCLVADSPGHTTWNRWRPVSDVPLTKAQERRLDDETYSRLKKRRVGEPKADPLEFRPDGSKRTWTCFIRPMRFHRRPDGSGVGNAAIEIHGGDTRTMERLGLSDESIVAGSSYEGMPLHVTAKLATWSEGGSRWHRRGDTWEKEEWDPGFYPGCLPVVDEEHFGALFPVEGTAMIFNLSKWRSDRKGTAYVIQAAPPELPPISLCLHEWLSSLREHEVIPCFAAPNDEWRISM